MARKCDLTGKRPLSGNRVSHANNKTRHRQLPNLQKKRIWDPEKQQWVTLKISTRALRTLSKRSLADFPKPHK